MGVAKKVIYRDSKNGRFIPKKTADRRPSTTEREVRPKSTRKKK
jgi:hypothetical protein